MASAAILAGGRARRLRGCDKTRLCVEGRTILERQLEALAQLTTDILLVRGSAIGAEHEAASSHPAVRVVHDRLPDRGPLAGLEAALAAARDDEVIVVAGDMPFISVPLLRHLLAQLTADGEAARPDIDAVVPRTERGYHPLCAVYRRRCHRAVARRLDANALKLTDLVDDLRVRVVDDVGAFGASERLLANVNTPADLDRVEALLGHEA